MIPKRIKQTCLDWSVKSRMKRSKQYIWVKYNIYKPIRNFLCHYGYGEYLPPEELEARRRKFIENIRNNNGQRRGGL
jgi:hypothetical protein